MQTTKKVAITGIFAVVALLAQSALAADVLISGKVNLVKGSKLVKFVSKSKQQPGEVPFALPAPGSPSDPTLGGATLSFEDLGLESRTLSSFTLDASGWTGIGNPPGSRGYRYNGKDDASDTNPKGTCRAVLVNERVIRATCKDDGLGNVKVTTPLVGADSIVLALPAGSTASRYCAEFGGDEARNNFKTMKRKNAPPPASCPSPECGDNVKEGTETCDGTDDVLCPGYCQPDCTCPTCGDNVKEGTERCDGTDDVLCPGYCRPDCTCPRCGDNLQEGTEECDGADDTACPGNCRTNCVCIFNTCPLDATACEGIFTYPACDLCGASDPIAYQFCSPAVFLGCTSSTDNAACAQTINLAGCGDECCP